MPLIHVSGFLLTLITAGDTDSKLPEVRGDGSDLVFTPGSTKVMLTLQNPLVQAVIRGSFDLLRVSIVFTDAFPNAPLASLLVKEALLRSAQNKPGGGCVYERIQHDTLYFCKILPVVSVMKVHNCLS